MAVRCVPGREPPPGGHAGCRDDRLPAAVLQGRRTQVRLDEAALCRDHADRWGQHVQDGAGAASATTVRNNQRAASNLVPSAVLQGSSSRCLVTIEARSRPRLPVTAALHVSMGTPCPSQIPPCGTKAVLPTQPLNRAAAKRHLSLHQPGQGPPPPRTSVTRKFMMMRFMSSLGTLTCDSLFSHCSMLIVFLFEACAATHTVQRPRTCEP